MKISDLKNKILSGGEITSDEAFSLMELNTERRKELYDSAAEITARFGSRKFDSCSIINARSGRCPEDCKWCAQSVKYNTVIDCYPLVRREVCMDMADYNSRAGIGRFSLVTSGREIKGDTLDKVCSYFAELDNDKDISLCASMGLLSEESMRRLRESGVRRYHCNMETAAEIFPTLCSTHSRDEKLATIAAARRAGMEICSGGIIGMGETMRQRVEFALELSEIEPVSIPINILMPIPGTPLEHQAPLTDEEVLDTIAIFRFVHPRAVLRYAGGRARISPEAQREGLRIGINGAIMGDLLTTVGAQIEQDKQMVKECGYEF